MHPISLNCRGISITCVYSRIGALVWHSYADEDWPRGEVAKGKIEAVDTDANRYKVNFFVTPCLVYNAIPRIFGKLLMVLQYNGLH